MKPRPKVTMSTSALQPRRGQAADVSASAPARAVAAAPLGDGSFPRKGDGSPDFSKMSSAQKVAFSRQRIRTDISRNGNGQK
jgi:hypothetical protein